jgi:hypothetical protein
MVNSSEILRISVERSLEIRSQDAEAAFDRFVELYGVKYDKAVACLQ